MRFDGLVLTMVLVDKCLYVQEHADTKYRI